MRITFEQLPEEIAKIHDKLDMISGMLAHKESLTESLNTHWLNIQEASQFLTLAVNTIYSKVSRKEIPYCKKGKKLYFSRELLTEWIQSGTESTLVDLKDEAEKQFIAKHKRKVRRIF